MPPQPAQATLQPTMATRARRPGSRTDRTARRRPSAAARALLAAPPPVTVETLRERWALALSSAQSALRAAQGSLRPEELRDYTRQLALERDATAGLLQDYARNHRASARYMHLALAPWEAKRLLGLPDDIDACVFNLDGVLLGSASLHLAAWTETFDEFIMRRIERTGGRFALFNPRTDYAAHIHGRPRLEGVRAFLATRGIRLPEGDPSDPPGAETVYGLANRKNQALRRRLAAQGLTAYEGSRRFLETARDAGIHRAVVSASANTPAILARAGLSSLVEARVDGTTIVAEHLRARPAPDILLAACDRVGVGADHTAVFETSPAGVAAARAGGFALVVGVDRTGEAKALREAGADRIVGGLTDLLDNALAA
jgi:HAD superfamily hydrolase (TIGR01509 family)